MGKLSLAGWNRWPGFQFHIKADLHYGDHHSKLVRFEAQKNIFYV
jgi:hypothetical protein